MVKVEAWSGIAGLRHGFSTRAGGLSLVYGGEQNNLGLTKEDNREAVLENRAALVRKLGGGELRVAKQVHSARVVRVGETLEEMEADGLVTDVPGVLLGVLAADCVPVLVADVRLRVAGAFHAGWRGTAAGIVGVGVERMMREFGCRGEDLVGAVGPSIGRCCYAVGRELRERFAEDLFDGHKLDLWEANRRQLVEAGVGRVTVVGECTQCCFAGGRRKYFSHRGDAGVTGRGMGVVGWE